MARTIAKETSVGARIGIIILILFGLMVIAALTATLILLFNGTKASGNVAIIPVEGVILASGDSYDGIVTADTILADIAKAEDDPAIKAVVFRINSPGGSVVGSDEIVTAINNMEKPSVAVIREAGASGAYWAASATDHVIANSMSITGSIGVIGSYLSFGKFLSEWNVTYNQLISGDRKDVGTPFREPTPAEKQFLQQKLDTIHEYFIDSVAENRNMSVDEVTKYADGSFLLGTEAKDAGLVDELGGEEQAYAWLNATYGIEAEPVVYEHKMSLLEALASLKQQSLIPAALSGATSEAMVPMAR